MRSGRQRHPVEIVPPQEHPQGTGEADAYNAPVAVDQPTSRDWARIEQISGGESFSAQQFQAGITDKVTLRFRTDITARHRIRVLDTPGRELEIINVLDEDGRRREITLMCREAA